MLEHEQSELRLCDKLNYNKKTMKDFLKKIKKWLWEVAVSPGIKAGMKTGMKAGMKTGMKKIKNMKQKPKLEKSQKRKGAPWYPFKTRYQRDPKEKTARVFEVQDTKTVEKKPIKYRSK